MNHVDEGQLAEALRPLTSDATFRTALGRAAADPTLLSLLVLGLGRSDDLCAAGVSAVRDETLVQMLRWLRAPGRSDREAGELTRALASRIAPEQFEFGRYRYEASVGGAGYYFSVVQANRVRLRSAGRCSRLALYLTTTFGHRVAFRLLVAAVLAALERTTLASETAADAVRSLEDLAHQHRTRASAIEMHEALLATDRSALTPTAIEMIDGLRALTESDYRWIAELAVGEIVRFHSVFADRDTIATCLAEGISVERDTTTVALS